MKATDFIDISDEALSLMFASTPTEEELDYERCLEIGRHLQAGVVQG